MKKLIYLIVLVLILGLVLSGCLLSNISQVPATEQSGLSSLVKSNGPGKDYGTITLSGGYQAGHFPEVWDLTTCGMTISFTYNANGLVDDAGAHAWAALGIRQLGYGDFNPTWQVEGAGVWLATDYDWTPNTFDPDPVGAPNLDLDDKLILQKAGGQGEGAYNLPSVPSAPGNNHRVWWDRDGVNQWQNGETANTGGIYDIEITLTATSATNGEAFMKIKDLSQGFETDGNWDTIELTPAGMTFTGDMTKMQVFYGLYGYGATHSVSFKDISVNGCLVPPYNFIGFLPPVDNLPTFNAAKAGSAIPVKFSLSGNQGLNIFVEGYPKSYKVDCDTIAPLDDIEATVTAGGSSLNYDAIADQYVYVWKTDKAWAGTCRKLVVLLNDGTSHEAYFTLK